MKANMLRRKPVQLVDFHCPFAICKFHLKQGGFIFLITLRITPPLSGHKVL